MRWSAAYFQSLSIVFSLADKNKMYKTLEYWSRDMLNFEFLEKGLEVAPPPHFVNDFSRKMFLKLLTDQFSLPGCLYFWRYWSIGVLQLFVKQDVMS